VSQIDPTQDAARIGNALAPAWEHNRQRLFESFRPVSEWLVNEIGPQPGQTILELAAGPGETGFLAAERVGPDGQLISTDVAPGMVNAARRGAEQRGLSNVECRLMDAQQIDLPEASVDGVICRFGLMLVPDQAQAFREARRVLRRGGRLAYAVMGAPDRNPWLSLFMGAVLRSGYAPPSDPFAAGSPFSLAAVDRNRELLGGAGFSDVRVEGMNGLMHFDDFDDYWGLQSTVGGPAAILIASLSVAEVNSIRATLEPTLAPFKSGNAYDIPSLTVTVSAT
jgi:SAM-dependent methyltransferase